MLKEKLKGRKDLQPMLFRRAWLVSKESFFNSYIVYYSGADHWLHRNSILVNDVNYNLIPF